MKFLRYLLLCVALTSCIPHSTVVQAANTAVYAADLAEAELARRHEAAIQEALRSANPEAAVAAVNAKFRPAWDAYEAFLRAYDALEAAIELSERLEEAGDEPLDPMYLQGLAERVIETQVRFARAV